MLNQNDIIKFLSDQLPDLKEEYNISKIGLFGSFARNEQNEKSDIDILLEFKPGTENIYEKKAKLREFPRSYFHRNIDLCREKYIKPFIKDYLEKEVNIVAHNYFGSDAEEGWDIIQSHLPKLKDDLNKIVAHL